MISDADDRVFFADQASAALLGQHVGDLSDPASLGWQQVKQNASRTVWRGQVAGLELYVKHFHGRSLGHRLKRLIGKSDAMSELRFARHLGACGVPTTPVLAVVRNGSSEWLVSRAVIPSEPADAWHARQLGAAAAGKAAIQRAIIELATAVGRMHAGGVVHADLHCGNVLIRQDQAGQPMVMLMDLHRMHRRRRLSRTAMAANLAQLAHDRLGFTTRTERLRFLKHYLEASGASGSLGGWHCLVERFTRSHRRRQHARRDQRARGTNRYFSRLRLSGGWKGQVMLASKRNIPGSTASEAQFNAADWAAALAKPLSLFEGPGVQVVKDSASSLVVRRGLPVGGQVLDVYIKRSRRKRRWKALADCLRPSRAMRAFRLGHALLTRGIATAVPLAAVERRAGPCLLDSILITEAVDCPPLHQSLRSGSSWPHGQPSGPGQRKLAREIPWQLGRMLQRLHDDGFAHRDLKAANILVRWSPEQGPQIILVDLDGLKQCSRITARQRFQGLMRLNVSLLDCPAVNSAGRLRMLLGYLRRPGCGRINFKPYWRTLEDWSARKLRRQVQLRRRRQEPVRRPSP